MKSYAKDVLCELLNLPHGNVRPIDIYTGSSLASRIENDNGSIFAFVNTQDNEKYVVKIKNENYWRLAGSAVNIEKSETFDKLYNKGYKLYYVKDTYLREHLLYSKTDSVISDNMPALIASKYIDGNCIMVLPFYEFQRRPLEKLDKAAMEFLAKLHTSSALDRTFQNAVRVNILDPQDYTDNKELVAYFNKMAFPFVDFPREVIEYLSSFTDNIDNEYKAMLYDGLVLCHGDYAQRNLGLVKDQLIVLDWELSSVLEPQFDIVTYLINYYEKITPEIIKQSIGYYFDGLKKQSVTIDKKSFHIRMKRNLCFYFVTRLNAVALLNETFPIDYIESALHNFMVLWNFLSFEQF